MNGRDGTTRVLRLLGGAAALITIATAAIALFASRSRIVTLVSDDSYYYLQVAKNLAATGTSTFDGVTRTSGYHPLFAILLAALHALLHPAPDAYVRLMLGLNVALHALAGMVLYRAGCRLRDRLTGALAAIFYLANPHAALWTLSGMEAALSGFALSLFFLALLTPLRDLPRIAFAGTAAALAVLARTDNLAVVLLATPVILFAHEGPFGRRLAAALTVAMSAIAALGLWTLYIHAAMGTWIQGSARIKILIREYKVSGMGFLEAMAFTFDVFQKFVVKSFVKTPALKYVLLVALIAGRALFRAPMRRAWFPAYLAMLPLALAGAYALKLTRTATWYYVPPVLALTLLAAMLARRLLDLDSPRSRAVAAVLALLVAAEGLGYFAVKTARGRNVYQRDMLELAEWMHDHLPPGSTVGAWDSGIYSFYSGLRVVNLDGLMNNDIAELMEANRPLWPAWRARGVDSVANYELWYAGNPGQYWQYWKDKDIRYIAGSTRWLRNIPETWDGARRIVLREPGAQYSASPKALYEIQWGQD